MRDAIITFIGLLRALEWRGQLLEYPHLHLRVVRVKFLVLTYLGCHDLVVIVQINYFEHVTKLALIDQVKHAIPSTNKVTILVQLLYLFLIDGVRLQILGLWPLLFVFANARLV